MKRNRTSQLYQNILALPFRSPMYYIFGCISQYKESFIFGLLMGQFSGGQTNSIDESCVHSSPIIHPVFQP